MAGQTQEGIRACGMIDDSREITLNWSFNDDESLRESRCVICVLQKLMHTVDR